MRQRGAKRREQVELLPHRRHHPGHVAARIGVVADRAHDPAVERVQGLFGDLRQRSAVLLMAGLADRQLVPFDGEAGLGGGGLHHLDGFRNDFEADIVAEQNSNFQSSVLMTLNVMPSLVPGIHVLALRRKTWMAGT